MARELTTRIPALFSVLAAGAVALTVSDSGCFARQGSAAKVAREFVSAVGSDERERVLPLLSQKSREFLEQAADDANHMVANRHFSPVDMIRSSFVDSPTKVAIKNQTDLAAVLTVETNRGQSFDLRLVKEGEEWRVDLLDDPLETL